MGDEADKKIIVSTDEIELANPPDPEESKLKIGALIADITDLSAQVKAKANEVTPEFLKSSSREQINTKRLEFETIYHLYDTKIKEIRTLPMATTTANSVDEDEKVKRTLRTQVEQILSTSRFAIASTLKKTITGIYNQLKEVRESVTLDYLQTSTEEELSNKRSEISSLYSNFITKYQSIQTENLTDEDNHELITQKVYAESAANNVDKFITNGRIKCKRTSKNQSSIHR